MTTCTHSLDDQFTTAGLGFCPICQKGEIERLRAALDTIVGMCLGHREIGKIHALAVKTLRNDEQKEPKQYGPREWPRETLEQAYEAGREREQSACQWCGGSHAGGPENCPRS